MKQLYFLLFEIVSCGTGGKEGEKLSDGNLNRPNEGLKGSLISYDVQTSITLLAVNQSRKRRGPYILSL